LADFNTFGTQHHKKLDVNDYSFTHLTLYCSYTTL